MKVPPIVHSFTSYRFISFNFDFAPQEQDPFTLPTLTPCEYVYPCDDYYIKIYFFCPEKPVYEALGKPHGYEDPRYSDSAIWTFRFGEPLYEKDSNMFNIKESGIDNSSSFHDMLHLMVPKNAVDSSNYCFWSLRFDARYCYQVFNLLEHLIPFLCFLNLPKASQCLSAWESALLGNTRREFLPPSNSLFTRKKIAYSALYFDYSQCSVYLRPLSERLRDWPTLEEITNSYVQPEEPSQSFFPPDLPIHCKIADLGNSCFTNKHYTAYIQTRQYRSPEAILCADYDVSTDIWSAGCIIFELITGDYLFNPEKTDVDRDSEHLALIEDFVGPLKQTMFSKMKTHFFTKSGNLKYKHQKEPQTIATLLHTQYLMDLQEAEQIESFLLPMLQCDPRKRATAEDCLNHPWLSLSH